MVEAQFLQKQKMGLCIGLHIFEFGPFFFPFFSIRNYDLTSLGNWLDTGVNKHHDRIMKIDDCLYMQKDFNPCVYCERMHLSLFRCPEIHSQHAKRKTDQTVDMHRLV